MYYVVGAKTASACGPDRAIVGVDEPEGRYLAGQMAEGAADDRVIRVSVDIKAGSAGWWVTARKGFLAEVRKGRQIASIDLRGMPGLPGQHNHQNACAAYAALRAVQVPPKEIEAGFQSFQGLPHRSQLVAEQDGVRFVNDSKATNVDAAAKALQAFDRVRWIVGGQVKDGGLSALEPHWSNVAKAYVIGRQAAEIALELKGLDHVVCTTMEKAVAIAAEDAEPGDTVLLAPAAASFDQYDNFEKRGDDFKASVAKVLNAGA